jgi:hypothetical protein
VQGRRDVKADFSLRWPIGQGVETAQLLPGGVWGRGVETGRKVLRADAHEKAGAPYRGPGRRHDVTPWAHHNRVLLCQATLSIGPYLPLNVQFQ